jgi:RNA polymerase sigma factor (sigma-70 family)
VGGTDVCDQEWHDELYARWRVQVIKWLAWFVGPEYGACEDLAQEVFIIAWNKREEVRESPRGWLYQTARKVAANHRRGRARFDATLLLACPLQEAAPDEARNTELLEDFRRAFTTLCRKEQEAFFLHYHRFTDVEIADIVGISKAAVRQRIHRARHKLSRRMDSYSQARADQGRLTLTGGSS